MTLNIHGSNAEYWRDDNPFIRLWLRFGDDLPVNNFQGDTPEDHFSGCLRDSSTARAHLAYRSGAGFSVVGLPVSGIAPAGSGTPQASGLQLGGFGGSTWIDEAHGHVLFHHHMIGNPLNQRQNPHIENETTGTGRGRNSFGSVTQQSGFMVAGWLKIPAGASTPAAFRPLYGDGQITATMGGSPNWLVHYVPQDDSGSSDVLRLVLRHNAALSTGGTNGNSPFWNGSSFTSTVDNAGTPFNVPVDEPFFFCFTVHKGLTADAQTPAPYLTNVAGFGGSGSGLLTMYLGTESSGLFKVSEHLINGTEIRGRPGEAEVYAFGNRERNVLTSQSNRGMPAGTVVDEFVVVQDGYMGFDRIEHYMNSGILQFPENNPERPEFVPQNPGTDKLQAYYTFDLADSATEGEIGFAGENSAPETSGIFQSAYGNRCRPIAGIRGGSGVRMSAAPFFNRNAPLTSAILAQFWNVPVGSGYNHLWPDIKRTGQMTWILWMLPSRTNNTLWMPIVGWRAGGNRHHAWSTHQWQDGFGSVGGPHFSNGEYDHNGGGWQYSVSGALATTNSGPNGLTNLAGGNNAGFQADDWQLWALCIDFTNGLLYHVKDAKHVVIDSLNMVDASGWDANELLSNTSFSLAQRTTLGAAFMVSRANNLTEQNPALYDDLAVYDRILTLPEMSGYALSGIAVAPIVSPLDTSFKRTLGYWKLDQAGEEVYDPEGVSGIRYSDSSWYRHHLTNVSGSFSIDSDTMNSRVGDESLRINTSGAMLSTEAQNHGANLDFSSRRIFESSGFMCGTWMFLPSGDLETQGNGSSGLFGDHHIMGAWGQSPQDRSWQLGVRDNKPYFAMTPSGSLVSELVADGDIPFERDFFIFAQTFPSGGLQVAEIYLGETPATLEDLTLVARDESFVATLPENLDNVGPSGFSLLNVPDRQQGFPSGTRLQGPFVYGGSFNDDVGSAITSNIAQVKRAGINDNVLSSGLGVSVTDPSNISHWRFDQPGAKIPDVGKEQNFLRLINQDAHTIGIEPAIHSSGAIIRRTEYLDTLPNNTQTRRLDLGSGNSSWTVLSWIIPPAEAAVDTVNMITAKGAAVSGTQIFTPQNSQALNANASGKVTVGQNGDLAPGQWNHMAVVFDRDNNEFTTIINGRYAGSAFDELVEVPINNSGFTVGGRGDDGLNALFGGPGFSGQVDDMMVFERALSLPEISGLAANSYNYVQAQGSVDGVFGGYISGLPQFLISGLIGAFMHGQAQDLELFGGYISGVSGFCQPYGGFIHGRAFVSGQFGGFMHGAEQISGVFGHFIHGLDSVSGFFGGYTFGQCEGEDEFDCTLNFSIVSAKDFDARLGVEKTQFIDFDARLGVIHITQPPGCTLDLPLVGTVASGLPFDLTVQGSGFAFENKTIEQVRFTFADFKGAETGTLVGGEPNSGLFEATRQYDTPGWYTVKIEILDSFGYRSSCCQPFLLLPSGSTSGAYLATLPGIELTANIKTGSTIQRVLFQHALSGLDTISGILEYTDFADQQESLVTSLEMPSGTQFTAGVREHDYTMPGRYCPVWAASGNWGVVSDTISDGIDFTGF